MGDLLAQGIDSIERKEKAISSLRYENDFKSVAQAWWDNWKVANGEAHALKVWGIFGKNCIFRVWKI